ncbi:MAG: DUF3794 domain-containing protein [Clostridia bacterium]|nr:DUF3794 domain-containing protein [Clostridia bacterium]
MQVNMDKQKINVNKNIVKGSNVIWIEQDVLVPDTKPDVMKIIKVDECVNITSTEVAEGSIRISGNITYYIMYIADSGKIRGINISYPFVKVLEGKEIMPDMKLRILPIVRNIIYSLPNERKISLKSEIIFRYKLMEIGEIELLKKIEDSKDMQFKISKDSFINIHESKEDTLDASEDIMLPDTQAGIKDILRVTTNIVNTEYKVSYNKILLKGEIGVTIIYTTNTEQQEITKYITNIPFTGMLEFSNIQDNNKFDVDYNIKNFEISVDTSNDTGKMLNINAEVSADATMYEEKEIEYINDFYSIDKELNYKQNDVSIIKNKQLINKIVTLTDNIGIVPDGARMLDSSIDISNVTNKVSGGNVYVNGNVKVNVMYDILDGNKIENKVYDMLIDTTIPIPKDIDEKYVNVSIDLLNHNISINNNSVEANSEVEIQIEIYNAENIDEINDIKFENLNEELFDNMNIYIVKKGDTLWKIAKKYKTSVDKIAQTNMIVDPDKIDIGQKLLIIR